ncbi:MAG: hypothetical protein M1839_002153 [Geoglossum umbratile]|nr:MAG: hypothetical protein M1839_002153 [Geoglossum umbratile]
MNGQTEWGPIWSKDYRAGGTCSGVLDGAYAVRLRQQLMRSLGVMTRGVDLLFRVIDNPIREQYHMAWEKLQPAAQVSTTEDELFTLRAVLINVLTEAHIDCNDWENGWAWIGVLGDFNDGDLCIPQLGIQCPCRQDPLWACVGEIWNTSSLNGAADGVTLLFTPSGTQFGIMLE